MSTVKLDFTFATKKYLTRYQHGFCSISWSVAWHYMWHGRTDLAFALKLSFRDQTTGLSRKYRHAWGTADSKKVNSFCNLLNSPFFLSSMAHKFTKLFLKPITAVSVVVVLPLLFLGAEVRHEAVIQIHAANPIKIRQEIAAVHLEPVMHAKYRLVAQPPNKCGCHWWILSSFSVLTRWSVGDGSFSRWM